MRKLIVKKEIKVLLKLGFKIRYPDLKEPDYCEYHLKLRHPILKKLHIVIEDAIYVYCREAKGGFSKGKVLIVRKRYSFRNLREVMEDL
jgi:hypothetical protein